MFGRMLKNSIKNQAGMTLVEVIAAVTIISIIAAPLLTLFLTSAKNNALAGEMTDATYCAQKLIEDRVPFTYTELLASQTAFRAAEGRFYYEASCEPAGPHDDFYPDEPAYMHLIYNGADVLAVGPDGKSTTVENASFTLNLAAATYKLFSGSVNVLQGTLPDKPLIIIVNGSAKDALQKFLLYVWGAPAKVIAYTGAAVEDGEYSVTGLGTLEDMYSGIDDFSTSMGKTRVKIYASETAERPICEMEDILTPRNPGR